MMIFSLQEQIPKVCSDLIVSSEVWMPKNNGLNDFNSTAIYEITESESDIYLATGSGVYSSSNDGDTWNQRLYTGSNYALQVLKYNNGTLLAGPGPGSQGLYRSTNGGNSWDILNIGPLANTTSYSHLFFSR